MTLVREHVSEPRRIPVETPIHEAAQAMGRWHVGSLVVDMDGEPVGLVTDRDLALHVLLGGSARNPVGSCASRPLLTVREDATSVDAITRMRASRVRRLGVVDRDGALVGVISADDLFGDAAAQSGALAGALRRELRSEQYPPPAPGSLFGKE